MIAPLGLATHRLFRVEDFLAELASGEPTGRAWAELSALTVAGGALYGAVIGSWTGPRMALYAAIKLPLVLELTVALTLVFAWLAAQASGLRLGFGQVLLLSARPLAVAAAILASLAPVALLFTFSAPPATIAARTAHNLLYLMHTAIVGLAGLVGTVALWRGLARLEPRRGRAGRIFLLWLVVYAVVGGEVAWALRPFVGSVYLPVTFLRDDALDGNVYEFIITDILPHLLGL